MSTYHIHPFSSLDELRAWLCDNGHEDSIILEDPDYADAAIGVDTDGHVVYSYDLMVESLSQRDGISEDDVREFIDYNTIRALPYMGPLHPIVLYGIDAETALVPTA